MQEIEVKLRISDSVTALALEAQCRFFAIADKAVVQRDEYFDTSDGQLQQNDLTVRIRQVANRSLVALKGPRVHQPGGVYRRIELEFDVTDEASIRRRLDEQGFVGTVIIEKRRIEFRIKGCVVALDTVPFLGSFVEIEGPSPEAIEQVRSALGLSNCETESRNYTELLEKAFLDVGRPTRPSLVATFAAEGRLETP